MCVSSDSLGLRGCRDPDGGRGRLTVSLKRKHVRKKEKEMSFTQGNRLSMHLNGLLSHVFYV